MIPNLSARLCPKRAISPTTPLPINKAYRPADDNQPSRPGSQREHDIQDAIYLQETNGTYKWEITLHVEA